MWWKGGEIKVWSLVIFALSIKRSNATGLTLAVAKKNLHSIKEGWSKRENPKKTHVKGGRTGKLLEAVRGKVKCVEIGKRTTFEELPFSKEVEEYAGMVQVRMGLFRNGLVQEWACSGFRCYTPSH